MGKLLAEWFWTDRWMGSSGFLLPMEERGVYREMLTQAWHRGARLPNDHEAIRRAVGATEKEWKRCWPSVGRFWRVDGDSLVNDTQLAVYAEALAIQQRASERGSRGGRARAERRSSSAQVVLEQNTSSTQVQPESKPPDSGLRTPTQTAIPPGSRESARARSGMGSGVMAGALQRDHLNCRPPCIRICVSQKQHGILRERFGGDPASADRDLDAFYAEVRSKLSDLPIGERPWQFWEQQFAAKHGGLTVNTKTAGNFGAAQRFVERGKS